MNNKIVFSVIIPHRDSTVLLSKLLNTIPRSDTIEVIVVDNSIMPIKRGQVDTNREFTLLYSSPERGAGGARNVGCGSAKGKWLIFADADDYFEVNAFDVMNSFATSGADIVYSCARGVFVDTGKESNRGDVYTSLVRGYIVGDVSEEQLRLGIAVPWCKMVKRDLVERYNIKFDEVVASNDIYFSMLIGYYASSIEATDKITYVVTVSKGTLSKRRDYNVMFSRFCVSLRYNRFMKDHGHTTMQKSIMNLFLASSRFGLKCLLKNIGLLIRYRQNPFIGVSKWAKTFRNSQKNKAVDAKYITC